MGKIRDLAGQTHGLLTLNRRVSVDRLRRSIWEAQCACGKLTEVIGTRVTSGHVKSCGCQAVNRPVDISGRVFGRLKALHPYGLASSRAISWLCLCTCGNVVVVSGSKLRYGSSKSCGCLSRDLASSLNRTHGMSGTPTYSTWLAMWARCTNPANAGWLNYGGRGIAVCARWRKFENFLADMGIKPEGLTLERKNNEKGYNRSNCCWATWSEQNLNKRPRRPRTKE
jgi:hypothetical protein